MCCSIAITRKSSPARRGSDSTVVSPSAFAEGHRCNQSMSAQFHRAFPSMIGGCIVSWGDKSCEASHSNSILCMTRSILLWSACNSCRQWEVDRCTAETTNGNTSQDSAKTAGPITLRMPMIPRAEIILMRSSIDVFCTDVLLAPRLSGLHIPLAALHAIRVFAKKISIYENDTAKHSHMQSGSFHIWTN